MKDASARHFALLLMVVAGVLIGAEVVCGCFPGEAGTITLRERARYAAVDYLAEDGGEAWRSHLAEVTPAEGGGWRVFVRREPAMPGGHAIVLLDDGLNVVRHIRGR